jgi:hypothetical protein
VNAASSSRGEEERGEEKEKGGEGGLAMHACRWMKREGEKHKLEERERTTLTSCVE